MPVSQRILSATAGILILAWTNIAVGQLAVPGLGADDGRENELDKHIQFAAEYQLKAGSREGVLMLTAKLPAGHHLYALRQSGKMPPSKLVLLENNQLALTQPFRPDSKPILIDPDPVYDKLEKHTGNVVFWAPFQLSPAAQPEKMSVVLQFTGTVCSAEGMCFPIRKHRLRAVYTGKFHADLHTKTAKK